MIKLNKEGYKKRVEAIEAESKKKLAQLAREYALTHNPVKVGDILDDSCHKGKVISIKWMKIYPDNLPSCAYLCERLTKKGLPFKKSKTVYIYQRSLKKINGEEVK